jgi:hypothetical protein
MALQSHHDSRGSGCTGSCCPGGLPSLKTRAGGVKPRGNTKDEEVWESVSSEDKAWESESLGDDVRACF